MGKLRIASLYKREKTKNSVLGASVYECCFIPVAGVCVANGSTEADTVEESNARYSRLLASKVSGDKFTDGEMQTLNSLQKVKEVQTNPFATASVSSQACLNRHCCLSGMEPLQYQSGN